MRADYPKFRLATRCLPLCLCSLMRNYYLDKATLHLSADSCGQVASIIFTFILLTRASACPLFPMRKYLLIHWLVLLEQSPMPWLELEGCSAGQYYYFFKRPFEGILGLLYRQWPRNSAL